MSAPRRTCSPTERDKISTCQPFEIENSPEKLTCGFFLTGISFLTRFSPHLECSKQASNECSGLCTASWRVFAHMARLEHSRE